MTEKEKKGLAELEALIEKYKEYRKKTDAEFDRQFNPKHKKEGKMSKEIDPFSQKEVLEKLRDELKKAKNYHRENITKVNLSGYESGLLYENAEKIKILETEIRKMEKSPNE